MSVETVVTDLGMELGTDRGTDMALKVGFIGFPIGLIIMFACNLFFPVSISVVVRSATSNEDVADAFVEFTLGDLVLTTTTDEFGLGIVTFR